MFWSKEFWIRILLRILLIVLIDLNGLLWTTLDYYVWSVVERVTNKSRHPNVTLKTAIEAAFVDMTALHYNVHANASDRE